MLFGICLFVEQTHHLNIPIDPEAVSLFDQQPNVEQQFLARKLSIGLFNQKITSLLAPTDQQISNFSNFLLTYLNRSS